MQSIQVSVERGPGGLHAHYRIEGDLDRVRVPSPSAARRADGLWRHTCCELFVSREDAAGYQEFNLSPSGEWAAYAFSAYREGAGASDLVPDFHVKHDKGRLELHAEISVNERAKLRVAVAAVIEDTQGTLSYWALAHPPGKPDFHHRDGFALELP